MNCRFAAQCIEPQSELLRPIPVVRDRLLRVKTGQSHFYLFGGEGEIRTPPEAAAFLRGLELSGARPKELAETRPGELPD
jgi:hypothetical protein